MTPTCNICTSPAKSYPPSKNRADGSTSYRLYCVKHEKEMYGTKFKYRLHKKDHCESCGFHPEHKCQLDVDHIDGDKSNNSEENLQTLCANCHRLKTHLHRDYKG